MTSVQAGQLIGYTGHTGNVRPAGEAGAHLHYEIRVDGQPVDPMPILRPERTDMGRRTMIIAALLLLVMVVMIMTRSHRDTDRPIVDRVGQPVDQRTD